MYEDDFYWIAGKLLVAFCFVLFTTLALLDIQAISKGAREDNDSDE